MLWLYKINYHQRNNGLTKLFHRQVVMRECDTHQMLLSYTVRSVLTPLMTVQLGDTHTVQACNENVTRIPR